MTQRLMADAVVEVGASHGEGPLWRSRRARVAGSYSRSRAASRSSMATETSSSLPALITHLALGAHVVARRQSCDCRRHLTSRASPTAPTVAATRSIGGLH